jgi:hypothetical protein
MFSFRRFERPRTPVRNPAHHQADVTIRPAFPDDAGALIRLAATDSSQPIAGDALLAEVAGELWAAVSLADGRTIADPFRPSAELVGLLELRAAQLTNAARTQPRRLHRLAPLPGGR